MSYKQDHIIAKQSIEISFDSLDNAFGVQDRIAELYYEKLQPRLGKLLDELYGKDRIICFEKLEVDCGIIATGNWEEEWVEAALRKLADQLRHSDSRSRQPGDNTGELLFYLSHGYLPWNSRVGSVKELESGLTPEPFFIRSLLQLIANDKGVASRLVGNFSQLFVARIVEGAFYENGITGYSLSQLMHEYKIDEGDYFGITEEILDKLARSQASVAEIKTAIRERVAKAIKKEKKQKVASAGKQGGGDEDSVIYINNAGLVIFHPFFPPYLQELGLRGKDDWTNEQGPYDAAIALQCLAHSLDEMEEVELVLPKILCGLPVEEVITEGLTADETIRLSADELTKAVIGHWTALKNTGVDSFRAGFVQREGKLTKVDHGWLLQVERKPIDVLFGSLPWGIGVVRLPWMGQMIFTEWA